MKIVDRLTFLGMPAGTIYAKYEPCFFQEMGIKGETLFSEEGEPRDWLYQDLITPSFADAGDSGEWFSHLDAIQDGQDSSPLERIESRDGCFDADQLFAIWEAADIRFVMSLLQEGLDASN